MAHNTTLLILTAGNITAFALQFVAYFQLQRVAGPVYLSQIGLVSAAVGTTVAVLFLEETLPQVFAVSVTLMVTGVVLFQMKNTAKRAKPALAK